MKKPSLTAALASKAPPAPAPVPEPPAKAADTKLVTSLRIEPEDLRALKIIAAGQRGVKVNDLVLQAIKNFLALHAAKP
jgi:predicted HicB family RNase H-like nuclease